MVAFPPWTAKGGWKWGLAALATALSVAGSVGVNKIRNETRARLLNSNISNDGSLTVKARMWILLWRF